MSNAIQKDVENLVEKELADANKKFPLFNSSHEGYAVLLEEVEETQDELALLKMHLEKSWQYIKNNDKESQIEHICYVQGRAKKLACEAIQVAAMAQKFVESLEGEG